MRLGDGRSESASASFVGQRGSSSGRESHTHPEIIRFRSQFSSVRPDFTWGKLVPPPTFCANSAGGVDKIEVMCRPSHLVVCMLMALTSPQMSAEMVISEILYDAAPTNGGGEFIELANLGDASIDVSGWVLTDAVSYTFPAGTTVQPGDRLVVARRAAAAADFYGIDVVGQYVGRLGNGGETIVLADNSLPRRVQDVVSYEDEIPWPTEADGGGPSLELDLQSPDNSDAASWFIGQPYSPGAPNSLGATNGGDVAITEILYKPLREEYRETFDRVSRGSYMERDTDDFGEYVEITNRGSSPIDLGGWRFTSGIEYTFEEATLDPGAILIVAADPERERER